MIKGSVSPFLAVLVLAACHGDSGHAPAPKLAPQMKAPAQAKRGPTPEELTAGMVEAVTVGKSTVPILLKFDLPERPVVGEPLDIVLALLPQAAGSATLQVSGSDGLQLAPGVGTVEIPSVESTQAYRVTVATTPTIAGVQLLGLSVALTHDDSTETRTFSIPVIVATAAEAAAASKGAVPDASQSGKPPSQAVVNKH